MAVIKTNLRCDLQKAVEVQYLRGNLFSQDVQANEINVAVLDGGEPAAISGTVTAKIIRSDGGTVSATGGTISGNIASITLPAAAYAVPGVVSITVQLTDSGVITTIAAIVTNIYKTSTEATVDPGTIIPSVTALVSQIETAVASIPADYSSLWTSLAPAFSASKSGGYKIGEYVTNGGALYVCTAAHTGSWVAGHFAATNLGAGLSELKSAVNCIETSKYSAWESGNYKSSDGTKNENTSRIRNTFDFGIPTGCQKVHSENGFEFCIYAWDASGTYQGSYHTDGTFQANGTNVAFVTDFDCSEFPSYYFRVSAKDSTGSANITTSDGENIRYQFCDDTLTKQYKAADAKKTGDEIGNLKGALIKSTGNQFYNYTTGEFIYTNSSPVNINYQESETGYAFVIADCSPGDIFLVSGRGSISAALWTFIDDSGVIKGQSTSTTEQFNVQITAPTGATKLIAQSNRPNPKCQKGVLLAERVSSLETKQADDDTYIEAIKIQEQFGNVFEAKITFLEGKYYYNSSGTLTIGTNAAYNGFIIPVTKNKIYTFVTSNIVLLDKDKKPINTSGSWDYEAVTTCNSGNAYYFAVCYRLEVVPQSGYAISQGLSLDYGEYSIEYYAKAKATDNKPLSKSNSGAIADGGSLSVTGSSSIKDGQFIGFKGKFSSFGTIKIDFAGGGTNYVSVTSANLVVSNNTDSVITEPHGLTIENDIFILLELKDGKVYVSVTSKGITFKYDCVWNQTGATITYCSAKPTGMAFTDAKLSVTYSAAKRDIWYFGDSYMQFNTDTRIPYYLQEYGYDKNAMINAVSGGTTAAALGAFQTLLNYGTPKIAVLATGMNDGSDSGSPVYGWITRVPTFISICESYGIIPVLCTIPTVPTVNNEYKNAWIKSHDYRYIDYAKAVGANASGEWYGSGTEYDMLASDGVHPSVYGGNALFTQLITDLPEIMGE